MLESLFSLVVVATLGTAALGVGRPLWAALRLDDEDRLEEIVWSLTLGLIAWGWIIALLGALGQLRPAVLVVLTVPAAAWGIGELLAIGMQGHLAVLVDPWFGETTNPRWPRSVRILSLAAGIVLAATCLAALAPPTASDAVSYHLELPKRFLIEQAIIDLPDVGRPASPLLAEMWYAWALALGGPVAAQLVHWSLGGLLAAASVVLARPVVGRRWCWAVAAVVLLIPGVQREMSAPLNDVALALMTTLAASAWWRAVVCGDDRRWFVMLGIALGGAMSIRHAGLLFAIAVGVLSAWYAARRPLPWRAMLTATALAVGAALAVVGCWYLRAAWSHGNFLAALGREVFDQHVAPLALAILPWQLTMRPEQFGGRACQLGPLFLMVLPGLAVARRLRGLAPLLALAAVYVVGWAVACQDVRRLLPAVPLLTVGLVWMWHEWRRLPAVALAITTVATSLVLASSVISSLAPLGDVLPVVVGLEDRRDYLLRNEPTYATAMLTQDLMGREVHILSQDPRAFYFHCRVTPEASYRERTHYDQQTGTLVRRLREAGFTHLLLAENAQPAAGVETRDDTLVRLVEAESARRPVAAPVCLSDSTFHGADGSRRYRLLMLR